MKRREQGTTVTQMLYLLVILSYFEAKSPPTKE